MANLVKLYGGRVELPYQAHQYSLTPPAAGLQEGLEAFLTLQVDGTLHGLPLSERQQVTRFLYKFGHLLFDTLFPGDAFARLEPGAPLLLELQQDWSAYPWELLNDGNRWLAPSHGVMRFAYPPTAASQSNAARSGPLRVLGASAAPLPLTAASRVGRDTESLGTRFITNLPHLAATPAGVPGVPFEYKHLEHASLQALEQGLAQRPEVLLFSGFASEEGWYLESDRLTPQCAPWEWLLQRIREAVPRGLKLVVLADSLGLAQPLAAVHRTRELLRAGVSAVIRVEGRVGRDRQQDYLRGLLTSLADGTPVEAAHQAAMRDLFRDREEAWEWSYLRLYPQGVPNDDFATPAPLRLENPVGPELAMGPDMRESPFATPPSPPAFRARRRCFNRSAQQKLLFEALCPEKPTTSPLVFLSGPRGSGKTHLALEIARRLRRRFAQILYLPSRALMPDDISPLGSLHTSSVGADDSANTSLSTESASAEANAGTADANVGASAAAGHESAAPLLSELALHLGADVGGAAPVADAREALLRQCADGASRLLILDRWERRPGYDAFCEALQALPTACRVLLVSRGQPPLLPGAQVRLEALTPGDFTHMFGTALQERLTLDLPQALAATLEERSREDLLLARLLLCAPELPGTAELQRALQKDESPDAAAGSGAAQLIRLLIERTLPHLDSDAGPLLPVLAFFPWLVHRDVLAEGADLEAPRLDEALRGLQRLGWVDAHDGDRWWGLHPRLQAVLAERTLTLGGLERLQGRLLRAYRRFLSSSGAALNEVPSQWLRYAPPMLAWAEERCEALPEPWVRHLHRLGVERVNLAELALLLADCGEWRPLSRLTQDAQPLTALRELRDVSALLERGLLMAGEQQDDPLLQAEALNRMAHTEMRAHRAEAAIPLLERAQALLDVAAEATVQSKVRAETVRLLSRCYERAGRVDAAERLLTSAAEFAQRSDQTSLLTFASQSLARIWARKSAERGEMGTGGLNEGHAFLSRQAAYLREHARPLDAAIVQRAEAELLLRQGDRNGAERLLQDVLGICRREEQAGEAARTLLALAECRLADEDAAGAFALVSDAAADARGDLDLEVQGRLLSEICRRFEQERQLEQALDGYLRIRQVLEQIGDREALIGVLDHIGGLYYQLGEQAKSTQCYEERLHLQADLQTS